MIEATTDADIERIHSALAAAIGDGVRFDVSRNQEFITIRVRDGSWTCEYRMLADDVPDEVVAMCRRGVNRHRAGAASDAGCLVPRRPEELRNG